MRIAYFMGEFPAPSETFVLSQVRSALAEGHEVHLFLRKLNSREHFDNDAEYEYFLRNSHIISVPDRAVSRLAQLAPLFLRLLVNRPRALLDAFNLKAYGKHALGLSLPYILKALHASQDRNEFDVVHAQFGPFGVTANYLKRNSLIHGSLVTSFRGSDATSYPQGFLGAHAYRTLFQDGRLFLPVSDHLAQILIQLACPPDKIEVLRSAVDTEYFKPALRPMQISTPIQIIAVGRLVEKKGFTFVLSAIARLIETEPNLGIRLNIVGDGPWRQRLEDEARVLGIRQQTQFMGWLPRQQVRNLMQMAHIAVVPSVTSSRGEQEGIPNTAKESMAMALPLIATNHAGMSELVQHGVTGYLVPERDSNAIADRIIEIIENYEIAREVGLKAREFIKYEYDAPKLTAQLLGMYESLS